MVNDLALIKLDITETRPLSKLKVQLKNEETAGSSLSHRWRLKMLIFSALDNQSNLAKKLEVTEKATNEKLCW